MNRDLDDRVPLVPFVPFRCPNCGRHKPRTTGVRGRMRYHTCQECYTKYRSWELGADEMKGWHDGAVGPQSGS